MQKCSSFSVSFLIQYMHHPNHIAIIILLSHINFFGIDLYYVGNTKACLNLNDELHHYSNRWLFYIFWGSSSKIVFINPLMDHNIAYPKTPLYKDTCCNFEISYYRSKRQLKFGSHSLFLHFSIGFFKNLWTLPGWGGMLLLLLYGMYSLWWLKNRLAKMLW